MKYKLLVIDDELSIRQSLKKYLQEYNFEIILAKDVREAFSIINRNFPDLIIADIILPGINGYEFLKKIRKDIRFKLIPVILLSAKGMTEDRIKAYNIGCNSYLVKPIDPEELLSIINNILTRLKEQNQDPDVFWSSDIKNLLKADSQIEGLKIFSLTTKEQQILNLVVAGLMNKEIARKLNISSRNVEKYVSRLFNKTFTRSRTELVRYAIKNNLIIE
ncbi:[pt] two-component system, NarL family, response regulator [Galdieria sulphuraria]|uniref:Putative transcriptional regulator LuxR n=1 Tax=Galdieria sulphuraria TaxID=130081 RepID=M2XXX2_GALSU|nr:putative transcriptional regulator LuxR [Galdieria sulphuraria]XP_005704993.1 [pt] two-component system, NarL family, response regulator [Galdieria sulphuraria]AIG92471.1 putative transcriptional regulator LuxR [Galdieria sulphuraria]EME28473.1 [pt] two-component system, NarL family, response regulator [Galdieria sulphuraria]|eukprot:XP_005704993.1 [pt] two-component system, NarL family, response regulator [Galdieria sulphuraria]